MNRRALLSALAVGGVTSLSGCADGVFGTDDPSVKLAWLGVANYDETSGHRFGLRVERDGEVVHESSHTVGQKPSGEIPGAVADCTWGDTAGRYVVFARVDGGGWVEQVLTETFEEPPDCAIARVRFDGEDAPVIAGHDWCDEVDGYVGGCPAYTTQTEQGTAAGDSTSHDVNR